MKILKGKTYFARQGGTRRKVCAIWPFEKVVHFKCLATGAQGRCTIEAFEKWMRDPPTKRLRDPFTRVCRHCGARRLLKDMRQYKGEAKSLLWSCKGECHANRT